MRFIIPKSKEKAIRTLTIMGHSKEFVATLPMKIEDPYFNFDHFLHYVISSARLIPNMIPEINAEELKRLLASTVLICS